MAVLEGSKKPGKKNIVMLLLALVMGGLGVYFSKKFIEDRVNFYRSQMEVKDELVQVVVPKRNLLKGEVVTSSVLSVRDFPKKYVDINAINNSNYKIALGQRVSFDAEQGKPLLWAHLEGGLTPTFSGNIENGLRALTIPVDEVNSISGFLQPKDNVDLLLTFKDGRKQITLPFMQNLYVMATGVKTVPDKTGRSSGSRYSTITVQVTPDEAKKLILAQDVGKVTATLRNPDDAVNGSDKIITVSDLLGKPKPRKIIRKPKKVKKGIEFIIGGV